MRDGLAIDLQNVSKVYRGRVHALVDVRMRVRQGEVFGLLGPNGAGKSTLVKIMMSVVRPTRAGGTILGHPVGHKPTLARVGYLPENHRFPRHLTGRQAVEFFGALSNVDRRTRKRRAGELLSTVGMSDAADRLIGSYSKGMMQRVGLAQALIADPDLVVLDEPTDGVDPVGRRDIRSVLNLMRERGKTVFVNSHLLSELEMICERVAILVQGKVARQGTIDELAVARQRFEIEVEAADVNPIDFQARLLLGLPVDRSAAPAPAAVLRHANPRDSATAAARPTVIHRGQLTSGHWYELDGAVVRIGTSSASDVQPILDGLRSQSFTIRRLQLVRPSLEDLFIETVGDPLAAREAPARPKPENRSVAAPS